ncbi:MAG: peptidylprolyl isomerase [Candidatus Angelobacter sp.]
MTCSLAFASMLAHSQNAGSAKPAPPPVTPPIPSPSAAQVAPEAVVVSIHGLCPAGENQENSGSCTTTITKQQFEAMLAVMNVTNQNYSQSALRSIAESYVQLMALADAGQKAGIEKDPRFEAMMKIVRVRTIAEAYRRSLDEKFSNPPAEAIEAYYKENIAKYEQLKIDRVFLPLADPKRPQERATFEKKAQPLANAIHERAARGEDMNALQAEAYKTLGLAAPPATDLGAKRKGNFPPLVEKDIFALKPGEVTKVETDLSGFSFYKIRSREPIPLELVKADIVRELYQKNMEAAVKSATSHVHSELNEQFFKPNPIAPGPPAFRPAPHVIVQPGPGNTPASSAAPGATTSQPPSKAATPPK